MVLVSFFVVALVKHLDKRHIREQGCIQIHAQKHSPSRQGSQDSRSF